MVELVKPYALLPFSIPLFGTAHNMMEEAREGRLALTNTTNCGWRHHVCMYKVNPTLAVDGRMRVPTKRVHKNSKHKNGS